MPLLLPPPEPSKWYSVDNYCSHLLIADVRPTFRQDVTLTTNLPTKDLSNTTLQVGLSEAIQFIECLVTTITDYWSTLCMAVNHLLLDYEEVAWKSLPLADHLWFHSSTCTRKPIKYAYQMLGELYISLLVGTFIMSYPPTSTWHPFATIHPWSPLFMMVTSYCWSTQQLTWIELVVLKLQRESWNATTSYHQHNESSTNAILAILCQSRLQRETIDTNTIVVVRVGLLVLHHCSCLLSCTTLVTVYHQVISH